MECRARDRSAEKVITGFLAAGWFLINMFFTLEFVVRIGPGGARSPEAGRVLEALWLAGLVGGPSLVLVAAVLSLRTPRPEPRPTFVGGYTFALILAGALALGGAFLYEFLIRTMGARELRDVVPVFRFTQFSLLAVGLAAVAAGLLRNLHSRHAIPLTAALHVVLLIWFPIGTAMAAWWFLRIRPREDSVFRKEPE